MVLSGTEKPENPPQAEKLSPMDLYFSINHAIAHLE